MIPHWLLPPDLLRSMAAQQKQQYEARLPHAVPWDDDIKYTERLTIQGKTFTPLNLFPEIGWTPHNNINKVDEKNCATSPTGEWVYCVKKVPKGVGLHCCLGKRNGSVVFDEDVFIPCVHQKRWDAWDFNPWMSITPQEIITLRSGTKRAKGHTVLAGLGLGYQLIRVAERKQVTKITLVEKSQELVDWLWPRIKPHVKKKVKIIVGDANEVLPKLTADVALIDIFPDYGSNDFKPKCPNIKTIWCWGAAQTRD